MNITQRKLSLEELVKALQEQRLFKKDFVVPGSCLRMQPTGMLTLFDAPESGQLGQLLASSGIKMNGNHSISLDPSKICHDQLAEKLDIARTYYNKMKDRTLDLLSTNVNYWLDNSEENYLLRTFVDPNEESGIARAFLSSKYKFIDNFDVLMAGLEAVKESGADLQIQASDITDTRMYVRFVAPHVEVQAPELLARYRVPGNDTGGPVDTGVVTGFILTNSEVGKGGFQVMPRLVVRACKNGMIIADDKFRKMHLGSRMAEYTFVDWSNETKQKEGELIVSQVKDAIRVFVSHDYLSATVKNFVDQSSEKLEKPIDAIQNVCQELRYSDTNAKKILEYFMSGNNYTGFGLGQALTFYAHKDADADEQFELEVVATEVATHSKKYDKEFKRRKTND